LFGVARLCWVPILRVSVGVLVADLAVIFFVLQGLPLLVIYLVLFHGLLVRIMFELLIMFVLDTCDSKSLHDVMLKLFSLALRWLLLLDLQHAFGLLGEVLELADHCFLFVVVLLPLVLTLHLDFTLLVLHLHLHLLVFKPFDVVLHDLLFELLVSHLAANLFSSVVVELGFEFILLALYELNLLLEAVLLEGFNFFLGSSLAFPESVDLH
jgi:hypothetical protein